MRRRVVLGILAAVAAAAAAACGDGTPPPPAVDAASADAFVAVDATVPDAPPSDATLPDAPPSDASPPDAPPADATPPDAAAPDAAPLLTCTSCHGSDGEPAPPVDTDGHLDSSFPGVGAHRRHLGSPSAYFRPGVCADCHVVPSDVDAPGHVDPAPAELQFGAIATTGGVAAAYAGGACTVYCHGATLPGGALAAPVWTATGQTWCGSCHGAPPAAPHPAATASCAGCHPFTGLMPDDPARHADGVLDLTVDCTSCHGSGPGGPAPPVDTHGNSSTTARGVGAHAAHLAPSSWRASFTCWECHLLPPSIGAPAHIDGDGVAELVFGGRATIGGVTPAWNGATCADVYCHGATLSGGSITAPTWTVVDDTQDACGTCHGLPPTIDHPPLAQCSSCHGAVVDAAMGIISPALHVNGTVEVTLDCTSCHGTAGVGPAPPVDTAGNSATTARGVGAHAPHLAASSWRAAVACTECHVFPATVGAPGHVDGDGVAELTFGARATAGGVAPAWDGTTCADVYCHGATLSGGSITAPTWTIVDDSQDACGACHGLPPTTDHPPSNQCWGCHGDVVDASLAFVAPTLHVDGTVQVSTSCTSCHGTAPAGPAPPVDTDGDSATTARGVGAHAPHLAASTWRAPVACTECHVYPGSLGEPAHLDGDGVAELTFGARATAGGSTPAWDGTTCADVYCHGATLSGGSVTAPTWTIVDDSQDACGSCHGLPPTTGHPPSTECATCHGAVIDASGGFVNAALHVDGVLQVSTACGDCHALPPATGTHALHAGLAVPVYGGLGSAADLASPTGYAFGCGHCHPLDEARHMNGGPAEIELYDPAAPAGSTKVRSPTAAYAPGADTLVDGYGMEYTLGTCTAAACHAGTTTTSGPVPEPGVDFTFTGYPVVYPPYTVTREVAYPPATWGGTLSCGGCHGFPPRAVYPDDVAGAGESHSYIDPDGYEDLHTWNHGFDPLPCRTCHSATVTTTGTFTRDADLVATLDDVPIAAYDLHANGEIDVVFQTEPVAYPTPLELAGATWDPTTRTCFDVSCHFEQTEVQFGAPYRYTNSVECNACHRY